ncbi:hypothetical protein CIPAW_13G053100 [Carya illinoinensis]|uniref:DOMON domain-containing protein n=1 Tax=Carya illinoinensis TaxID=32201 RepID=A0A8T1NGX9_CARIL|nr:hypothetical protein CIPAW_13G053100 [Carya illinoinensis]
MLAKEVVGNGVCDSIDGEGDRPVDGGRDWFAVILGVLATALLVSPALSLTCTLQKLKNKNDYPNCTDLPHLGAFLHWNFNASNSSLSMTFIAPPAKTGGWVAWAINPNSTRMAGSHALLAYKPNSSAVTIQTYDIKSYNISLSGMNLSYPVWDLKAEESSGIITIYGKWKLPAKTEKVNQVWQVGPGIIPSGYPMIHGPRQECGEPQGHGDPKLGYGSGC